MLRSGLPLGKPCYQVLDQAALGEIFEGARATFPICSPHCCHFWLNITQCPRKPLEQIHHEFLSAVIFCWTPFAMQCLRKPNPKLIPSLLENPSTVITHST